MICIESVKNQVVGSIPIMISVNFWILVLIVLTFVLNLFMAHLSKQCRTFMMCSV